MSYKQCIFFSSSTDFLIGRLAYNIHYMDVLSYNVRDCQNTSQMRYHEIILIKRKVILYDVEI